MFNGRDGEWRCTVAEVLKKGVILRAEEQVRPQTFGPDLELIVAVVKKARVETIVEKAAELGAAQTAGYQWFREFKKALYRVESGPGGPVARSDGGKQAPVLDLIVTFISKLKDMALQDLRTSSSGELDDRQVLWVLTVPALWGQASRRWMREAAVRAGLPPYDGAHLRWLDELTRLTPPSS